MVISYSSQIFWHFCLEKKINCVDQIPIHAAKVYDNMYLIRQLPASFNILEIYPLISWRGLIHLAIFCHLTILELINRNDTHREKRGFTQFSTRMVALGFFWPFLYVHRMNWVPHIPLSRSKECRCLKNVIHQTESNY